MILNKLKQKNPNEVSAFSIYSKNKLENRARRIRAKKDSKFKNPALLKEANRRP
jgi:hypothetical protein